MASVELIQAVAVTAELCGRVFSPAAAEMFMSDLEGYSEQSVLKALTRCRKEVKGILTVSDVISRLDDGRPGPEEAWAMMPMQETQSVVWTPEMAQAFGVALPLVDSGEVVAARMAFKEAYIRLVAQARDERRPVTWSPSLGSDKRAHQHVLAEAVAKGRLSYEHAQELAPSLPAPSSQHLLEMARTVIKPVNPIFAGAI